MKPSVPVIAYYGPHDIITLAGTREDIRDFAEELTFSGDTKSIAFYVPEDTPVPFERFLREVRLRTAPGLLGISSSSDALVITGPSKLRHQLAHVLLQAVAESKYEGNFIERQLQFQSGLDHPFITANSLTFIVTIVGFCPEPYDDQDPPQNNSYLTKPTRSSHSQMITDDACAEDRNSKFFLSGPQDTTSSQQAGSQAL